jgi:hypothetical protein
LASEGVCTHTLGAKSQFQRHVKETTTTILNAITEYRNEFPILEITAQFNPFTRHAGSFNELYRLNALLYDIDQALHSGIIDFGKALVLEESVSCTGITHR